MNERARVEAVVHDVVAEILPGVPRSEITGDKHPAQLGADSVDRVEIVLTLLDRLGVDAPMARFDGLRDLDALVDLLVAGGVAA
jgi:polyketide biosynthesis acyl carrier protein